MSDQSGSGGAIYHHVSPTVAIAYRVVSALTLLFGLISVLITLIQGGMVSPSFFLLTTNLLLSGGLAGNLWWWYKSGEISEDRIYAMFATLGVLAFQCLVTDIWVFNYRVVPGELVPGTVPPVTYHTLLPNVTVTPIKLSTAAVW